MATTEPGSLVTGATVVWITVGGANPGMFPIAVSLLGGDGTSPLLPAR